MVSIFTGIRERVSPAPVKLKEAPKLSADAALEAHIKEVFKNNKEAVSPDEFKGLLGTLQNWIVSSNEYSLTQKSTAVADDASKLKELISRYNPAFATQLGINREERWINQQLNSLTETMKDISKEYNKLSEVGLTDKLMQQGLSEKGVNAISGTLSQFAVKLSDSGKSQFSSEEQKALLVSFLEKASQASIEAGGQERGAVAFTQSLTKSLEGNAFKFDKNFLEASADELKLNSSLIASVNVALGSTQLLKHINGSDPKALEENLVSNTAKWTAIEASGKLSQDELKEVKLETTIAIHRLNQLIKSDPSYNLSTDAGKENVKDYIEAFINTTDGSNSSNPSAKDKSVAEAKETYFNLVMNKAAETLEVKSESQKIFNLEDGKLGSLIGQGFAAIAIFTAFKVLTSGNAYAGDLRNGMVGNFANGGFLKKAAGLVFMATLINNTGLLGKEEDAANGIVKFQRQEAKV